MFPVSPLEGAGGQTDADGPSDRNRASVTGLQSHDVMTGHYGLLIALTSAAVIEKRRREVTEG